MNISKKIFFLLVCCNIFFSLKLIAQDTIPYLNADVYSGWIVPGLIIDGDTVLHVPLREITVMPPFRFRNNSEVREYNRLVRYVKKVYPYAVLANETLRDIERNISKMNSERERDKYVKEAEAKLRAQFEDELKSFTIMQGVILIKLIDRETGETSYELVEELRGSFTAFLFQGFARIFGHNLKDDYDAAGEDRMIEDIVVRIENGQL